MIVSSKQRHQSLHMLYFTVGEGSQSYSWGFRRWRGLEPNLISDQEPRFVVADIIHMLTPEARIIFILRDPVERSARHS